VVLLGRGEEYGESSFEGIGRGLRWQINREICISLLIYHACSVRSVRVRPWSTSQYRRPGTNELIFVSDFCWRFSKKSPPVTTHWTV
jgi:hypothetical protein